MTIIIYTHLLEPYPIKKTTVQPTKATNRSSETVDTFKKKAKPHTHSSKKPPKRKTPHCSQQRRPKGAKGRETHALQKQQQQQQLGSDKN